MKTIDGFDYFGEGTRVFEKYAAGKSELITRLLVDAVYRVADSVYEDDLHMAYGEGDSTSYPVDIEDVSVDPITEEITFSIYDGDYQIRNLKPEDGKWISRLKIDLPTKALEYMTSTKEEDQVVSNEENLLVYSKEANTGPIFAVQYINGFGSFVRVNGRWMMLAPDDESFDDMFTREIDPEKASEFLAEYDKGDMTVNQADSYAVQEEELQ